MRIVPAFGTVAVVRSMRSFAAAVPARVSVAPWFNARVPLFCASGPNRGMEAPAPERITVASLMLICGRFKVAPLSMPMTR